MQDGYATIRLLGRTGGITRARKQLLKGRSKATRGLSRPVEAPDRRGNVRDVRHRERIRHDTCDRTGDRRGDVAYITRRQRQGYPKC